MNDRTKNAKHGRRSEMSRNIRWAKEFIDGREHGKWNKISGFAAEKCQRKGVAIEPGSIVKATRSGLKFCEQMAEQCLRKLSTKKRSLPRIAKELGLKLGDDISSEDLNTAVGLGKRILELKKK